MVTSAVQAIAREAPPPRILTSQGWVQLLPLAIWSNSRGQFEALPLEALTEALVLAESKYALDRLDDRDQVEATIPSGSAVGTRKTVEIEVPSEEVWFLNRLTLTSPAESGVGVGDIVKVNVYISKWEGTTDKGKAYWSEGKGTAASDSFNIDLSALGELGEELRLAAGDKLTLEAELTGAPAGADLVASLTPYGRKGKRLVE